MEWRDHGILLALRRHGETSAIIEVFTEHHGRHAGVVRGGTSRKIAPVLQPGAQLDVTWRARLEDHIGTFQVEPIRSRAAQVMGSRLALAGLNAVAGLLSFCLPEREAHGRFYHRTEPLLDLLGEDEVWPLAYLRWEMALLDEMGFGVDLSECAVTGAREGLCYVSPKSGRAVSDAGAGEWADRLLPLPGVMLGQGEAPDEEVAQGFETTGYFLRHKLAQELVHRPLPEARQRFVDLFTRRVSQG
ncbi:DNA repair protein RecO [Alisedimentitalea sp. MJ-SS2]|uniref:DNA repair protein RecO n=1 Tax=Aliisedimentitalea sp. MJ-SS2 TaxID=3049795 RepID=UPI00290EB995|nr:DNA repair protein RecO [Alisedimentitalea sp. MJ-SS2]MDU8929529.1 DNA repair protein RecO [Alisedimentitalea sp. MJ-SS2]